ncbi:hypothetical protein [Leclercia adecarboxylata]|uniref:hypothetical protein n=1 Tax=Leclercia adecarboxylata TaxID=83655 RepID=UPI00384A4CA8
MKNSTNACFIFVEGETEKWLFYNLKQIGKIQAKKIVIKNFWCDDLKKYAINIPKNSIIYVIFDTDVIRTPNKFIDNVKYLMSRKHTVFLCQQTKNFEEELAFCCSISPKKLFNLFCKNKSSGSGDFKRDFISCSNPVSRLSALGINKEKLFSRDLHPSLAQLIENKCIFAEHFPFRIE